jgi:hypothetical protein
MRHDDHDSARSGHALSKLGLGFIEASEPDQGHRAIGSCAREIRRLAQTFVRLIQSFLIALIAPQDH